MRHSLRGPLGARTVLDTIGALATRVRYSRSEYIVVELMVGTGS